MSTTCEKFVDLSLSITNRENSTINSIDKAIGNFMAKELLDNARECSECKETVKFTKEYKINSVPQCLVVHLKRSDQRTHHVPFDSILSLSSFMSPNRVRY